MSKYDAKLGTRSMDIETIIMEGEQVIWKGKPKKSAFIVNKVVTMLPIALLWLLFDGIVMKSVFLGPGKGPMFMIMILFFAVHLIPVWIWLGNVMTAKKRWENTQYAMTNKRIIIQTGFIGMDYKSLNYKDICNVRLNVGVIDKLLKVGDIYFDTNISWANLPVRGKKMGNEQAFLDLTNVYELYPKLQKIVLDIQTDIEYPNELRPETNAGYTTQYKGRV